MDPTPTRDLTMAEHPLLGPPRVAVSAAAASHRGFITAVRSVAEVVDPAALDEVQVRIVDWAELDEVVVGAALVAVVEGSLDVGRMRTALARGASGVVERRIETKRLAVVLTAAAAGHTTVPDQLVTGLLNRLEEPPDGLELGMADLELLHDVAEGLTLEELAASRAQSSRTIRRELRSIWDKLGVTGRAPGLVRAARWGLLLE